MFAFLLKKLGHDPTPVEDGQQALDALKSAAPFDLVLLDIMMPNLDGFGVLEALKASPAPGLPPVIVISAAEDLKGVVRCLELGADDYLFKPPNTTLLKARLAASLERKRLRDQERRTLEDLKAAQARTERLLLSIFPRAVADRLRDGPAVIADQVEDATVLFAAIHNFDQLTHGRQPDEVVRLLGSVFTTFDLLCDDAKVEKIKTIGDQYMAAAGVPAPREDHAQAAADLALKMQAEVARINTGLPEPLTLRIGLATGPAVAGVIGTAKFAYDLWGPTVRTAEQMQSLGLPGAIQAAPSTYQRLKSNYIFEPRGTFYIPTLGDLETFILRGRRH
jgi:class 3 adenylate cyclase